jgi:hypothetical protein
MKIGGLEKQTAIRSTEHARLLELNLEQEDSHSPKIIQEDHMFRLVGDLESESLPNDAMPTRSKFAIHLLLHRTSGGLQNSQSQQKARAAEAKEQSNS